MTKLTITTTGEGGFSHTFEVEREETKGFYGTDWEYSIRSKEKPEDLFQARFKTIPNERIRLAAIDHYGIEEFVAKGIPEEIFEDVVRVSGKQLVSSLTPAEAPPTITPGDLDTDAVDERSRHADRMWRRIQRAGRATYDEGEDRFSFTPRDDGTTPVSSRADRRSC